MSPLFRVFLRAGREDRSPLFGAPPPSPSLREAIAMMGEAKKASGRRATYVSNITAALRVVTREGADWPLDRVTTADVERWCLGRSGNANTQATYVRAVRILFKFAIRRRWVSSSPVEAVEPISLDTPTPAILTVPQCRALMEWSRTRRPVTLAMFALALFAGVRPDEIARIGWDSVHLDSAEVIVDSAASKTRRRRVVHLMPAAVAWLAEARRAGADLPLNYRRRVWYLKEARAVVGLSSWPQDVLRHSCASYWYATTRDAGQVAANLGNSAAILMRHYRELVSERDAAEFWSIAPVG